MDKMIQQGTLEVICGPMFCGKSEELIRRLRRARIARLRIMVFKPAIDTRYGENRIATHTNVDFPATEISTASEIIPAMANRANVVGIDEAQFLDAEIIPVCQQLTGWGVRVIVAGLDLDFRGQPFGSMPQLLALADKADKLTAICTECGAEATRSQRLVESSDLVSLGAGQEYAARCKDHFHPPA
jgi:thymidine kinase